MTLRNTMAKLKTITFFFFFAKIHSFKCCIWKVHVRPDKSHDFLTQNKIDTCPALVFPSVWKMWRSKVFYCCGFVYKAFRLAVANERKDSLYPGVINIWSRLMVGSGHILDSPNIFGVLPTHELRSKLAFWFFTPRVLHTIMGQNSLTSLDYFPKDTKLSNHQMW